MTNKQALHESLQEHARSMPGVPPASYLTRWVVVRELVIPSYEQRALNFASGDASGRTLVLWDAEGLVRSYLREMYAHGGLQGWPPNPEESP